MMILILIILYIYFGYPIILFILSRFAKNTSNGFSSIQPSVTVIIPARNEASVIAKKINNLRHCNYPLDKIEILVVSDQSTDQTESIVKSFKDSNIRLISLQNRHGKTAAQNATVREAKGEIIVFSDANAMYDPDAVFHLVKHFEDPDVGCVSGELCYNNPEGSVVGEEENMYWKYEKWIKKLENQVGTILGANGSIYAIRRSEYIPLGPDIISDFIEPLLIAANRRKVIFEPLAKSYENSCIEFQEEFQRKQRIVSRSLYGLMKHAWLMNPFKHPVLSFELISHKLLRWLSPFFMIMLFVSNTYLLIRSRAFLYFFMLQCIFYIISFLGLILKGNSRVSAIFFSPYYFCTINYAALLGVIDYLTGRPAVFWEPIRKS
jgi:cellulose synthase/poly-beta-1,6-N-acetylglucosamine synthase-like glycosyltransferase